jgi:hypothetical protein
MKYIFIILCSVFSICQSQTRNMEYTYDFLDDETKPIYEFWKDYVSLMSEGNPNAKSKWKSNDKDYLVTLSGYTPTLYQMNTYNKLLYIRKIDDDKFELASMFYWIQDDENLNIISVVKYIIQKEDSKLFLKNYLNYSTQNWVKQKIGFIEYYYPENYNFNLKKAKSANKTIGNLNKLFDLNNETIKYYIPEDCDNQSLIIGLDYLPTKGLMKQCGYFDTKNNIVLATSFSGEDYKHELIHLINKKYPNAYYLLLTGLSVYHSSNNANLGKSSKEVLKIFNNFLKENEVELSFTSNFPKINNEIGTEYVIGNILIDTILEKGDLYLLKYTLENITNKEQLTSFIKDQLHIVDEDSFIRMKAIEMQSDNYKFRILL